MEYIVLFLVIVFFLVLFICSVVSLKKKINSNTAKDTYRENKVNLNDLKYDNKEFLEKDSNKDGYLMISELYPLSEDDVMNKIKDNNSSLNKDEFYEYVEYVFKCLIKTYNEENVNWIRPFCMNSLYYKKKYEIDDYKNNGVKRVIDGCRFKGCSLKDFNIDGDNQTIVVTVSAKMIDYAYDIASNELVFGSKNKIADNIYILTFLKKNNNCDKKFDFNHNICPNCGSSLKLGDDGICKYCDTMLVVGDYYWVLTDIKNIKI